MSNTESTVQFNELGLPAPILQAIESMGFTQPTPIQEKSIPALLDGKDILGEAQTGTGKTAAFGLPLLANLDANLRKTQMLVVCPTRELAIQVAEALSDFSKNLKGFKVATVYGGQSYTPQIRDLRAGPQVVVGTPGRLMDHIGKGRLQLDSLKACVLDEADEMLNMGFLEDIQWILEHVPDNTQMAFFSATMPHAIKRVTEKFLKNPVHVKIATIKTAKANITQSAWRVSKIGKTAGLERIAETVDYDAMLVFVRTRNDTLILAEHLVSKGFSASALNGDMNQNDRERIVEQLKNGKLSILIATDVVARGLDVPRITHVINYDLPTDSESYVHRIGRTGRAGRKGEAILFANYREIRGLSRLERATDSRIGTFDMPETQKLSEIRANKIQTKLEETIEKEDLTQFRGVLDKLVESSESNLEDIAVALLYQQQLKQPLFPKADPVDAPRDRNRRDAGGRDDRGGRGRDRNDRGGERGGRSERAPRGDRAERAPRRNEADFETFRFEVGRSDGVRPGDIVGAVANEINLDSSNIGHIKLHDNHSYVDLPKGMPKTVFDKLTQISIRNKRATPKIADANEKMAAEAQAQQEPSFRPRRGNNEGGQSRGRGRERRPFN